MRRSRTSLLSLPESLIREILSWSPDSISARALLSTCRAVQQHCHDPAAVALLLLRCRCPDYDVALTYCGLPCHGGATAVVQQLLQLQGAGPESGGPHRTPAALRRALLYSSSADGDAAAIRALLALPSPPDLNAALAVSLQLAVYKGPHLEALQALLDGGADLSSNSFSVFASAAWCPGRLGALQLLLSHCQAPGQHSSAVKKALAGAVSNQCLEALHYLLPLADPPEVQRQVAAAALYGSRSALQVLLSYVHVPPHQLDYSLVAAVTCRHAACAELLLDWGADVHTGDGLPLLRAVQRKWPEPPRTASNEFVTYNWARPDFRGTLALLLRRGAIVTPAVRAAAKEAGVASFQLVHPPVQALSPAARSVPVVVNDSLSGITFAPPPPAQLPRPRAAFLTQLQHLPARSSSSHSPLPRPPPSAHQSCFTLAMPPPPALPLRPQPGAAAVHLPLQPQKLQTGLSSSLS